MYKGVYSVFPLFSHCSRPGGKVQRAEPWQLRQEDCDAVWNELTHFKNLSGKLAVEK